MGTIEEIEDVSLVEVNVIVKYTLFAFNVLVWVSFICLLWCN